MPVCPLCESAASDGHHELVAEVIALRRAVDRKQQQYESAQRYWVESGQKALVGDTDHLRLRIDMALAGPIEMTETI